ncbi:MAG: four helix bundle protein [Niabella sp.]
MRDFRKYEAWQLSHLLVLKVYSITKNFPVDEKYGLISQIRRSAQSVPTNFAEGSSKISEKEFIRFLDMALGSATELDYQLELSKDLGYISEDVYEKLNADIVSIKKLIYNLQQKIINDLKSRG